MGDRARMPVRLPTRRCYLHANSLVASAEHLGAAVEERLIQLLGGRHHAFHGKPLVDRLTRGGTQPTSPPADRTGGQQSRSPSRAGSPGGTSSPLTPSSIASGVPPTRVATTGTPAAIDSSRTFDSASLSDGITEIVARGQQCGTSLPQAGETSRGRSSRAVRSGSSASTSTAARSGSCRRR